MNGEAPHPAKAARLALEMQARFPACFSRCGDSLLARLRLALQLPRFREEQLKDNSLIREEIETILLRIQSDQQDFVDWHSGFAEHPLTVGGWWIQDVPEHAAAVLQSRFHYIGSPRDGVSYGLYCGASGGESLPATLLTFSPFDLSWMHGLLPEEAGPENVMVLSRAYSFRWAPPNAFSYTFRRAVRRLQSENPSIKMILTYVNPNVGFTGASYHAANWLPFATERTQYDYLDGVYITHRELGKRLQRGWLEELHLRRTGRLEKSHLRLEPLQILAFPLSRELRLGLERREAPLAESA